jgi:hypothetical protein
MSVSPTTALSHLRICLIYHIWPLATSSSSRRWSCSQRAAALTEWRRSSENYRMFLVRFENRTSSMRFSSGNGSGIDVSLHKGTILKGMLPKLKSSKYILVYRSSLRTFWYTLVHSELQYRGVTLLNWKLYIENEGFNCVGGYCGVEIPMIVLWVIVW